MRRSSSTTFGRKTMTWQFRPNVVPDNFFDQMSYSAKRRIDQKLYATNCRIREMVFDELSCTHPNLAPSQEYSFEQIFRKI